MAAEHIALGKTLMILLLIAWIAPLGGFAVEIFGGFWGTRRSKAAAFLAVGCIVAGFVCSLSALLIWGSHGGFDMVYAGADHAHHETDVHAPDAHAKAEHDNAVAKDDHEHPAKTADADKATAFPKYFSGTFYTLAKFNSLRVAIDWHIDSLTLVMFTMVTLIASCIHIFAVGYMSDELTESYEDHEVHIASGHFHRPGRFYRFFAFLSLFSFSMLGLVIAGNVFMVFVFWELVGVCSYFLIGFYVERKSASTAANKAFIMNRVGDFGFLIGLMILWGYFGTFQFESRVENGTRLPGLFEMARGGDGALDVGEANGSKFVTLTDEHDHPLTTKNSKGEETPRTIPYFLLIAAGLGIFAGCVGKSAQFPLQTWLPDAMEGPTPVSALVHSATMVAAGVYLAGRFYPMFTPEVLLVIAYVGCITLFLAATIAVVATDIKRVLAYSTISQLGYMMLAIGVGGWGAGLFHLVTHAFFKSLMFLCSGSVIYGCHHVQEMPRMGGLRRKMPFTAYTMLVGVIAIAGLAIPGVIAFSGYHSKDAIVATAMTYAKLNPIHNLLFVTPLVGAGITAFYMFRLWFYTFAGKPRDQHVYDHAHESPWVMVAPLLILSVFAAFCAVGGEAGPLYRMIAGTEPANVAAGLVGTGTSRIVLPGHAQIHDNHATAGAYALLMAFLGLAVAYVFYGGGRLGLNPAEVQSRFAGLYDFLREKWRFDELYDVMFVRSVHIVARWATAVDKYVFDGLLHSMTTGAVHVAHGDRMFDENLVDGLVNKIASVTFATGSSFTRLQTGKLRQYVMFIVVGTFLLATAGLFWLMVGLPTV